MKKLEYELILIILKHNSQSKVKEILTRDDVDWEKLFQLIVDHKIFSSVFKCLEPYIPKKFNQLYQSSELLNKIHIDYNIKELGKIASEANKKGVDIVLVKGLSLSKIIYDYKYSRVFGDIDILVNEESIPIMEKLMFELGYSRKLDSADEHLSTEYRKMVLEEDNTTIFNLSHDNHEVSYKKKINNLVEVHVEIKRATSSIPKKHIHNFLYTTQTIAIDNFKVNTLDNVHTLIHLFSNTYHNTENILFWGGNANLRDYFDTYHFLRKFHKNIDLDNFITLCNHYNVMHKVVYILKNLNELFSDDIFDEIINIIKQKGINIDSLNSIVTWENSFVERIFSNKTDILHDFNRLLKKRCYSTLNKNYHSYYDLSDPQYIKFKEEKYDKYSFWYKFSMDQNNLTLSIKLSETLFKKIGKFKILWRLMDNGTNKEITYKDFLIKKVKNEIISDYGQVNYITYVPERFPERKLVVDRGNDAVKMDLTYSLDEISIKLGRSNDRLCYNIILLEEVLPDMNQTIGMKFSEFNMGVIKFS